MNVYSSKRLHQFVNAERRIFAVSGRGWLWVCVYCRLFVAFVDSRVFEV